MIPEIKKRQHARYSPSQLDRLGLCCRFKYKETTAMTDAGDEGTALHFGAETGNLEGLDAGQRADVQQCLDYLAAMRAGISGEYYELKEPKLTLSGLTHGHADSVIISPGDRTVRVSDFKFVRVEGTHDFQITTYAAACCEMLMSEVGLEVSPGNFLKMVPEKVETHIIAPRLGVPPEMHAYDAQQLLKDVRAKIEALYAQIEDPFNPPTPEPGLCNRCARVARCPAVTQIVRTAAPLVGLPLPEVFEPQSMVSTQDRALAQQLAQLFENWSETVKKGNAEYVKNGGEIPGFKLTTRSTGFSVPRENTLTAVDALKTCFQLDERTLMAAMKLSIPELAENQAMATGESVDAWKARLVSSLEGIGKAGVSQFLTKLSKADLKKLGKERSAYALS